MILLIFPPVCADVNLVYPGVRNQRLIPDRQELGRRGKRDEPRSPSTCRLLKVFMTSYYKHVMFTAANIIHSSAV